MMSHLRSPGAPLFRDHLETKLADWIRPLSAIVRPDVVFVGAPFSRTSISPSGAALAPQAIRELFRSIATYNVDHDLDLAATLTACDAGDANVHSTDVTKSRAAIRSAVNEVLVTAPLALPVVLGGDHSITVPSFEAVRAAVGGPIGLVQLDAHMDLRNLDDGGPTNGTPVRELIEAGVVQGKHVVQIGLRAFANAGPYREFAMTNGVTQFSARQVVREGMDVLIDRALHTAGDGTVGIYVTVDMDVLDQAYGPGVAAMGPGGITVWQLFEAVLALGQRSGVRAFDIVELDPTQDPRRVTTRTAAFAMLTFLTGYALGRRASGGTPLRSH
jgi:formiminoglutamase